MRGRLLHGLLKVLLGNVDAHYLRARQRFCNLSRKDARTAGKIQHVFFIRQVLQNLTFQRPSLPKVVQLTILSYELALLLKNFGTMHFGLSSAMLTAGFFV